MKDEVYQLTLFDLDYFAGKMSPEPSQAEAQRAKISGQSSRRSSASRMHPVMCLDLTPGHGNLLGQPYWEMNSAWLGECWTLSTGEGPSGTETAAMYSRWGPRSAAEESSLSQILEDSPHRKYYLSRRACTGILRRAQERGKALPPQLEAALRMQAGLALMNPSDGYDGFTKPTAFAANQRDEVRDLHDIAGALGAQPGMKQQTFVAGFSAGAGSTAGGVGYSEAVAPTLKGTAGGNCMPSVLCFNDQGRGLPVATSECHRRSEAPTEPTGETRNQMHCTEDTACTLRVQEHGHQPLVMATQQGGADRTSGNHQPMVFENHGIDSRYTGPHNIAPTMSARYGTGGNNVPLVSQNIVAICLAGNIIDREPENGGNGCGYQPDIAYTLTGADRHAVYTRQRVDEFKNDDVASTQSARQSKDATDLVVEGINLIRRLTPLECERLQGFPDSWTDIPRASDSARYKALGNSVAIPCVEYIMSGIAAVLRSA